MVTRILDGRQESPLAACRVLLQTTLQKDIKELAEPIDLLQQCVGSGHDIQHGLVLSGKTLHRLQGDDIIPPPVHDRYFIDLYGDVIDLITRHLQGRGHQEQPLRPDGPGGNGGNVSAHTRANQDEWTIQGAGLIHHALNPQLRVPGVCIVTADNTTAFLFRNPGEGSYLGAPWAALAAMSKNDGEILHATLPKMIADYSTKAAQIPPSMV